MPLGALAHPDPGAAAQGRPAAALRRTRTPRLPGLRDFVAGTLGKLVITIN